MNFAIFANEVRKWFAEYWQANSNVKMLTGEVVPVNLTFSGNEASNPLAKDACHIRLTIVSDYSDQASFSTEVGSNFGVRFRDSGFLRLDVFTPRIELNGAAYAEQIATVARDGLRRGNNCGFTITNAAIGRFTYEDAFNRASVICNYSFDEIF